MPNCTVHPDELSAFCNIKEVPISGGDTLFTIRTRSPRGKKSLPVSLFDLYFVLDHRQCTPRGQHTGGVNSARLYTSFKSWFRMVRVHARLLIPASMRLVEIRASDLGFETKMRAQWPNRVKYRATCSEYEFRAMTTSNCDLWDL